MTVSYQFGINPGHLPSVTTANLAQAQDAGAMWVRADIGWSTIDPTEGDGEYQQSAVATINNLRAEAITAGINLCIPVAVGTGGGLFPSSGSTPAEYGAMMAWLVGQCPGMTWEILNEPDYSGTAASLYTEIVQASYPAMKAVDPTCTVVAGVLSNPNTSYWSSCYSGGVKGNYDVISIHTYDGPSPYAMDYDPGSVMGPELLAFQTLMSENDDTVPLWITEFGWSTTVGNSRYATDAQAGAFTELWMTELESYGIPVVMMYYYQPQTVYSTIQQLLGRVGRVANIGGSHKRLS